MFGGYGLVFVAIACAAWASLATWSVHDPSLNNATRALPRNWLGSWGAVLADIAIQSLGLAAIILFLPLAAWGWHLVFHATPDRRKMRLWLAPVILLAAAFAALPQRGWPSQAWRHSRRLPHGGPRDRPVLARPRSLSSRLIFLCRHDDASLRLRHLDLAAHRAVGAAGRAAGEWANASLGAYDRHAYRRQTPPHLPPPGLTRKRTNRGGR
jgi:hypothetical protein